ncbi:MAG: ferredoxin--NADP reductase [Candidatus Competibacteraceae bacterium]|nr:MAG: ferredoxin--NADP reductase [Candidatus Competibacteraceae bacterium]
MKASDKYTVETITEIRTWASNLFSFKTTRSQSYRFIAGQFARLGVEDEHGDLVWRAYSICSAPYDDFLEFYSIVVSDGAFTSRLSQLKVGDPVLVEKRNYGYLTTDRFECGRDLWLLSTGTGLAPFLSILQEFDPWEHYENIVLVHSVRYRHELAYEEFIDSFKENELFAGHAHKLKYVQVVTRDQVERSALNGRITRLLSNGELEAHVGLPIDPERSRIMICGNPDMVQETRDLLTGRGLTLSLRGKPGNLAVENYW